MSAEPPPVYKPKRDSFYLFEGFYTQAVCRLLPFIARTGIKPNQVTLANIVNGFAIPACLFLELRLAASLLIQLYLFLDIVDGNLARYTGKSSRLGHILDQVSDRAFYTFGFLALGYFAGNSWTWLLAYAVIINTYALLTTGYIAPRIRAIPRFRRWGLKKWFMERKILFGMDLSTQDVIASVLLLTPATRWILPIITCLYSADLLYRLWELKRNEASARPL